MGTRFVASVESPVHAHYKQAIVDSATTGTWVLNKKVTPCIRTLKTRITQGWHEAGLIPADAFKGIQQVYFGGDMEAAPALAGQSAGLIHGMKSVQQIIDDTVAQFNAISQRLGSLGYDAGGLGAAAGPINPRLSAVPNNTTAPPNTICSVMASSR